MSLGRTCHGIGKSGSQRRARGVITQIRSHLNSAGQPWVTFALETPTDTLPCVCFPNDFRHLSADLEARNTLVVLGLASVGDVTWMRVLRVERLMGH